MTRRLAPAVLALVLALVVGLPALAWAQDSTPSTSGLGDLGAGAGAGMLVVIAREALDAWRKMRADERAEAALHRRDVDREAMRADIIRCRDLHNTLAEKVGRLDERLSAQATQAAQLHDDIGGIRTVLETIRDRLPGRAP